jgi:tripartite-type tricarboxylate transporter receptor subunit TctC
VLAVVNDKQVDAFPGVPAIGEVDPAYQKYMPWGSWFAVAVHKDTPQEIVDKLVEAFDAANKAPEFQERLKQTESIPMGISGQEALDFINRWTSITAWILEEAGAAKVSPEELGIPKPE